MNKYIDCHSHILPNVDDGSSSIEESIEMLKSLANLGFESVVLTPHYRKTYQENNETKNKIYHKLLKEVKNSDLKLKLFLSSEVRITKEIYSLINDNKILLLNNYLFLELSFDYNFPDLKNYLYDLQLNNIKIILVHPERYHYLTKHDYMYLKEHDVMFQLDYLSLIGKYGFVSKMRSKWLLKQHLIDMCGTDIHHYDEYYDKKFKKCLKILKNYCNSEEYNNITYGYFEKLLK